MNCKQDKKEKLPKIPGANLV